MNWHFAIVTTSLKSGIYVVEDDDDDDDDDDGCSSI